MQKSGGAAALPAPPSPRSLSDSPGLVDFAFGLVMFVLNLPNRKVIFWGGNSSYRRIVNQSC